jgi:hypothetical protein
MKTGNHTHLLTIDRRIDMLTIVDLHQEEELSSSNMKRVAGGEDKDPYADYWSQFNAIVAPVVDPKTPGGVPATQVLSAIVTAVGWLV